MEEIQTALTALTGAVNRLLEQAKSVESRLNRIENSNDLNELRRRLESIEHPVQGDAESTDRAASTLKIPETEEDLKSICRLPDSVRELRTFDGNPLQYVSWVHSVEMILKDFEIVRNKPIYRSIMQSIRQKVIGKADAALVSYNIFDNDWKDVKKILSLHYADKRDVQTLEHQLNQLSQGSSKLDEFYSTVNHQLSLIINKLKTESYGEETINALVTTHRNRALDIFIRGLNPELSKMVIIQRPRTLPEAYSACLELQNLTMRNNILHTKFQPKMFAQAPAQQHAAIPPRPPRPHFNNNQVSNPRNNWQQKSNNYRLSNIDSRFKPVPYPRSHHLRPEPMDVDRTVQTRKVDYMNRPTSGAKANTNQFFKQPRLYHINNDYEYDDGMPQEYAAAVDFNSTPNSQNFMEEGHQAYLT